jgi:hypothetical protein
MCSGCENFDNEGMRDEGDCTGVFSCNCVPLTVIPAEVFGSVGYQIVIGESINDGQEHAIHLWTAPLSPR